MPNDFFFSIAKRILEEIKPKYIGDKTKRITFPLIWRMFSAKVDLHLKNGNRRTPKKDNKGMIFTHCVYMGRKALDMT